MTVQVVHGNRMPGSEFRNFLLSSQVCVRTEPLHTRAADLCHYPFDGRRRRASSNRPTLLDRTEQQARTGVKQTMGLKFIHWLPSLFLLSLWLGHIRLLPLLAGTCECVEGGGGVRGFGTFCVLLLRPSADSALSCREREPCRTQFSVQRIISPFVST